MQNANKVYCLLKKIPKGKVTTYKELASIVKTCPRAIGSILRANKFPNRYPCYKVVMSDGKIGGYCGSGPKNIKTKIRKLKKDGIIIKTFKIDLNKYGYKFI